MSTTTVAVANPLRPLREGQIESEQDPVYGDYGRRRWYVGGQTARSWQVAWQALENLLDGPEGYRIDNIIRSSPISHMASLRYGNCLAFDLMTPVEYASQQAVCGA